MNAVPFVRTGKLNEVKRFMKRTVTIAMTSGLVMAGLSAAAQADQRATTGKALYSCSSGYYCAWKDSAYSGTKLLNDNSTSGVRYPSQKDAVSSGVNRTTRSWCGVNELSASPDVTVVRWFAGDEISNLAGIAGANDRIDHYDVISNSGTCPA